MSARQLRDYQAAAVEAVYAAWTSVLRIAIVLATGLGKTDVIARIATREARAGRRVICLVHRLELVQQIAARCRMHAPEIPVGIIAAGSDKRAYPITVAMTPTLGRDARLRRLPEYDVAIMDECHHASSPRELKILEHLGCFTGDRYPERRRKPRPGAPNGLEPCRLLGVTATMTRGDKRHLSQVWGTEVAYERGIAWAVTHGPSRLDPLVSAPVGPGPDQAANGWLACPHGRVVVVDRLKLGQVKTRSTDGERDYVVGELGDMVEQSVEQIVDGWEREAREPDGSYLITAAFTPNVASCIALADEFNRRGHKTEYVLGTTSAAERGDAAKGTGIYGRVAAGTTRVMVNVGVATEGWDCPPVQCIAMARPTKLAGLYQQIIGRGLRQSFETGKDGCRVIDFVGASRQFRGLKTLIDLDIPDVQISRRELDDLPCEICGGYLRGRQATAAAPEPCECPPPEPSSPGRPRLDHPAEYESVDLLVSSSPFAWLRTFGGRPFLAVGDRIGCVWAMPDGTYSAGHDATRGPAEAGHWIAHGMTLDGARAAVEAWAETYRPGSYVRDSAARRRRPAKRRVAEARAMGLVTAGDYLTRGELDDALSVVIASSRFDRHGKAV